MKKVKQLILLSIIGIGVSTFVYSRNATIAEAKEILGSDFLGPDEVNKVFGVIPTQELPFTRKEIMEIKRLGMILFPQIDKDNEGKPLTAESIIKMFDNKFSDGKNDVLLMEYTSVREDENGNPKLVHQDFNWHKNEDFYTKEILKTGWRVISKNVLQVADSKSYPVCVDLEKKFFQDSKLKTAEKNTGISGVESIYFLVLFERVYGKILPNPIPFSFWIKSVTNHNLGIQLYKVEGGPQSFGLVGVNQNQPTVDNGIIPSFLK